MLYKTTKGYIVNIVRRISTPCKDVVEYEIGSENRLVGIESNNKGEYITVNHNGKYAGRCYLS